MRPGDDRAFAARRVGEGVGHADDLSLVGGIRQDLLIAGHAGVEDHLADALALRAEGCSLEDRPVRQRQDRRLHTASHATWPATMVITARPLSFHPMKGAFLLLETSAGSSTAPSPP